MRNFKQNICLLLITTLLFGIVALPNIMYAHADSQDDTYMQSTDGWTDMPYSSCSWKYVSEVKTIYVKGTGAMPDFIYGNKGDIESPWANLTDPIDRIYIGDGITHLSSYMTLGAANQIKSIRLPVSLTSLGDSSLMEVNLQSLDLSQLTGLTSIGQSVFSSAIIGLLTLPNTIIELDDSAFSCFGSTSGGAIKFLSLTAPAITNNTFGPGFAASITIYYPQGGANYNKDYFNQGIDIGWLDFGFTDSDFVSFPNPSPTPSPTETPSPTPNNINFTDISNHWAKTDIQEMAALGIINGYPGNYFDPDANITRAEYVAINNRAFPQALVNQTTQVSFSDVKSSDWFYDDVYKAAKAGLINGRDGGYFDPSALITRQEAALVTYNYLSTLINNQSLGELGQVSAQQVNYNDVATWANQAVTELCKTGIINGYEDDTFRPLNNITRAESATIINRAYQKVRNLLSN